MGARWVVTASAVAVLVAGLASASLADDQTYPSREDVTRARAAATDKARDVATVQAELVVANQHLRESAIAAAQATEAFNGARWRLSQARRDARAADQRSRLAATDLERQQSAYAGALATTYQLAPELRAASAIVEADGIGTVIEQTYTLDNAESALNSQYDAYRASSTLAEVASTQAADAWAAAERAQQEAREARDAARAAESAATADAQAIAASKDALIRELAQLQGVSVRLAEQRQSALEAAAAEAAADAAAADDQQQDDPGQPGPSPDPGSGGSPGPDPDPSPAPDPTPDPDPTPAPDPDPPTPDAGAGAAISFARAQLGEPYRWGAAGPNAWDCSGLTMGSWGAGGVSLPHYSVAQYQQSTPISSSALRPGDLVFWGSGSSPTSIYHVALYVGDGQIIHAPRTGRPVSQESMYYWIPPTFFARP